MFQVSGIILKIYFRSDYMMKNKNICIVGSGNFATALGNQLTRNEKLKVTLISIQKDVVESINVKHLNPHYFPQVRLSDRLQATGDKKVLRKADFVFLAIPSFVVVDYVIENSEYFNPNAIIINLAKGFSKDKKSSIVEAIKDKIPNTVCTLKGPTFAREVINNVPTAMTLGAEKEKIFDSFKEIFSDTNLFIDYSDDIIGVELLSILKNIYAIVVGIADAHFNSPNLKFFVLNKAFNEMRLILIDNGGKEHTMFNYCGFGDFNLTALNDLSRNRTLGLLMGKGFFTNDISNRVLLEGKVAVEVFCEERYSLQIVKEKYPIIAELYQVFNDPDYEISDFVWRVINKK